MPAEQRGHGRPQHLDHRAELRGRGLRPRRERRAHGRPLDARLETLIPKKGHRARSGSSARARRCPPYELAGTLDGMNVGKVRVRLAAIWGLPVFILLCAGLSVSCVQPG